MSFQARGLWGYELNEFIEREREREKIHASCVDDFDFLVDLIVREYSIIRHRESH